MRTKDELLELREQVVALRRAGKSRRDIKEILAVGNSTLNRALRGEPAPLIRKNTGDDYHGCLTIGVRRSARLYRQIEGWAGAAMASVDERRR